MHMNNLTMWWAKNSFLSKEKWLRLGLIVLGLNCMFACKKIGENEQGEKQFVLSDTMAGRIQLAEVKLEKVKSQLLLPGKIVPDENKRIDIFPLVGGNVIDVKVELGDYVNKGAVLAIIRSGEVADFEKQLINAQSDLLIDQKNLKIAEDLYQSQLSSEKDLLSAKKEVEKSQAELSRIKEIFQIYHLGKASEYYVTSPLSGYVIEKNINRDMQLRSDKGDNIFTISQLNEVWVLANVNESDISRIKEGYDAEISTIAYPDRIFKGKVDKIYNVLDPETKTMKIRVKLSNANLNLKPEMNATVMLNYEENTELLAIPSAAVIFDKGKNWAMVYHSKAAIDTREVQIYKTLAEITYITAGLKQGEKVISKDQLLIYDALND